MTESTPGYAPLVAEARERGLQHAINDLRTAAGYTREIMEMDGVRLNSHQTWASMEVAADALEAVLAARSSDTRAEVVKALVFAAEGHVNGKGLRLSADELVRILGLAYDAGARPGGKSFDALSQGERHEMIDAAVKEMTPNFTNETAAWNAWNNLNTSPAFIAAFLALHRAEAAPSDTDETSDQIALRVYERMGADWVQRNPVAAMERAAADALSRSSQPVQVEPTVEEWAAEVTAERARHPKKGYTAEHDRMHGLKHLANWAIDYARRGKGVKASSMVLALVDAAQPVQVEVTDEMVERAAIALHRVDNAHAPSLTWGHLAEWAKSAYRTEARGALTAALGGGE